MVVQDTPSRKLDQYIVRFPDGMRDRIKRMAADNNRSMNAEIVSLLSMGLHEAEFLSSQAETYKEAELARFLKEKPSLSYETNPHIPTVETTEVLLKKVESMLDLVNRNLKTLNKSADD